MKKSDTGLPQLKLKKGKYLEPKEEVPVTIDKDGNPTYGVRKRKAYKKMLQKNKDGSFESITLATTICKFGSGIAVYPSVAISRALKIKKDTIFDTKKFSCEGKIGLLVTKANITELPRSGVERKRAIESRGDRYCIPIAKIHRDALKFNIGDRVAVKFFPKCEDREEALFIYKGQGMIDPRPPIKKKTLIQEAIEIADNLREGTK